MAVQNSTTNISIGKLADERGISRSNVSINQSNIRELIGRSDGAANSSLSVFRGASRHFSAPTVGSFFRSDAPSFTTDTEQAFPSDYTMHVNNFLTSHAYRFSYRTTGTTNQYNVFSSTVSGYYGQSTLSETADVDFLVRNNGGAFQVWVRPGTSSRAAYTENIRSTYQISTIYGTQTYNWQYNFKTFQSTFGNNINGRYNSFSSYYSGSDKALPTNGNYTQLINLPLPATGINSDTGADSVKVQVVNTINQARSGEGTHYLNVLGGTGQSANYWPSTRVDAVRTPTSITSNTNFNNGGHTTLIPDGTTEYAMGPTSSYSFSVSSTTSAAFYNMGTHYDQNYRLKVQIKKNGNNRGQYRTVFVGAFKLSTEIAMFNNGSIPTFTGGGFFESGF